MDDADNKDVVKKKENGSIILKTHMAIEKSLKIWGRIKKIQRTIIGMKGLSMMKKKT